MHHCLCKSLYVLIIKIIIALCIIYMAAWCMKRKSVIAQKSYRYCSTCVGLVLALCEDQMLALSLMILMHNNLHRVSTVHVQNLLIILSHSWHLTFYVIRRTLIAQDWCLKCPISPETLRTRLNFYCIHYPQNVMDEAFNIIKIYNRPNIYSVVRIRGGGLGIIV